MIKEYRNKPYDKNKLPPIKIPNRHTVKSTNLRIPEPIKQRVVLLAEAKGYNNTQLILEAIQEYLDKPENQ